MCLTRTVCPDLAIGRDRTLEYLRRALVTVPVTLEENLIGFVATGRFEGVLRVVYVRSAEASICLMPRSVGGVEQTSRQK